MSDPVIAEVEVAAPADAVWRALREPAEIRRWFGWDYEGLDEEIRQIFVDGAKADDGAEWFSSPHQRGVVREDGALVIRTPTRTIVSRYD
jgi:uncharacterized protein YndB with AHSA1/START domain